MGKGLTGYVACKGNIFWICKARLRMQTSLQGIAKETTRMCDLDLVEASIRASALTMKVVPRSLVR